MQQAYSSTNPAAAAAAATYMNSSFYNASSYPYSSLSSSRGLNSACKATTGYISSPYSSPASPFQNASQTTQYSPYASYSTPGTSSFAQGFSAQVKTEISIVILTTILQELLLHLWCCFRTMELTALTQTHKQLSFQVTIPTNLIHLMLVRLAPAEV